MTWLILAEIGVGALGAFAFILFYAAISPWRSTAMGRHIMAFAVATAVELVSLLLLGLGLPAPLWVFAIIFGALDLVLLQQLRLLWLAQRKEN